MPIKTFTAASRGVPFSRAAYDIRTQAEQATLPAARGAVDLANAVGPRTPNWGHREALVRHLCARPGESRTALAAALGVSKPTIGGLVRELIADGWLIEREDVPCGDTGRPPRPLFIDPTRLVLIGAEMGVGTVRVVVTSLTGRVLAHVDTHAGRAQSAKGCIEVLARAMLEARGRLDGRVQRVVGAGVALPGRVDEPSGFLEHAAALQWRDVPVVDLLARRLAGTALAGLPLFVQNEAHAAALGEAQFNPLGSDEPLLYVSVNHGAGIGAGVILHGRPFGGARGFAGEAGHIVLQADGPPCACGRRGCADALFSRWATGGTRSASDDPLLADERQPAHAGAVLGALLHNLIAAYDPACVVLGGSFVDGSEAVMRHTQQTLDTHFAAANGRAPTLRRARFGEQAVAVGAAALVRYRLAGAPRPAAQRLHPACSTLRLAI
jgi:predicted NBD/HSP70 family sugar kinase